MTSHLTDISHIYNFYSELFVMQLLGSLLYAKNVFHKSADSLQSSRKKLRMANIQDLFPNVISMNSRKKMSDTI